ncbi:uncharacterized protein MONBRDRAFT_8688 [Monosiga brevicollis MX1]|uniref:Uncharacterized protein n=1 Tax=Monosiga brevicollis TaxID=81824 RepID=A9V0T9_MONBE|nr:uncharacterized protein MONBRDRAFT_8688 [Monosiga brevicollis MX1]EDQ88812.1 predicted protein [Monosiga brevicollis MX1]|eukprot:XP_001746425.1 hypothetical protein [Monosiga brevicollis MX1]
MATTDSTTMHAHGLTAKRHDHPSPHQDALKRHPPLNTTRRRCKPYRFKHKSDNRLAPRHNKPITVEYHAAYMPMTVWARQAYGVVDPDGVLDARDHDMAMAWNRAQAMLVHGTHIDPSLVQTVLQADPCFNIVKAHFHQLLPGQGPGSTVPGVAQEADWLDRELEMWYLLPCIRSGQNACNILIGHVSQCRPSQQQLERLLGTMYTFPTRYQLIIHGILTSLTDGVRRTAISTTRAQFVGRVVRLCFILLQVLPQEHESLTIEFMRHIRPAVNDILANGVPELKSKYALHLQAMYDGLQPAITLYTTGRPATVYKRADPSIEGTQQVKLGVGPVTTYVPVPNGFGAAKQLRVAYSQISSNITGGEWSVYHHTVDSDDLAVVAVTSPAQTTLPPVLAAMAVINSSALFDELPEPARQCLEKVAMLPKEVLMNHRDQVVRQMASLQAYALHAHSTSATPSSSAPLARILGTLVTVQRPSPSQKTCLDSPSHLMSAKRGHNDQENAPPTTDEAGSSTPPLKRVCFEDAVNKAAPLPQSTSLAADLHSALRRLNTRHTVLKAALVLKAVAQAQRDAAQQRQSQVDVLCQRLDMLHAEREDLRHMLLQFETRYHQHSTSATSFLAIPAQESWERAYQEYDHIKALLAQTDQQLHQLGHQTSTRPTHASQVRPDLHATTLPAPKSDLYQTQTSVLVKPIARRAPAPV